MAKKKKVKPAYAAAAAGFADISDAAASNAEAREDDGAGETARVDGKTKRYAADDAAPAVDETATSSKTAELTEEQRTYYKSCFDEMDKDGSGTLDAGEVRSPTDSRVCSFSSHDAPPANTSSSVCSRASV